MTDNDMPPEDHLHEARWHVGRAGQMENTTLPGYTVLLQTAQSHALVSIAESMRLAELRAVIDGPVFAMLDDDERASVLAEMVTLLHKK